MDNKVINRMYGWIKRMWGWIKRMCGWIKKKSTNWIEDKTLIEDKHLRLALLILAGLIGFIIFVFLEKKSENIWYVSVAYIVVFALVLLVLKRLRIFIFYIFLIFLFGFLFNQEFVCLQDLLKDIQDFFKDVKIQGDIDKKNGIDEAILVVLTGLPVFILLWIFRTHDIREQIEKIQEQVDKTQEQISQTELFKALADLTTNNPLAVKTAVLNLTEIDKRNKNYRHQIRIAFIERLKQKVISEEYFPIKDNSDLKLTYAQYILKWLAENKDQVNRGDFYSCCFDYQEFTNYRFIDGKQQGLSPFTILFTEFNTNLSFIKAHLVGNYLKGANLQGANLQGANLEEAFLQGAFLQGADLQRARLKEARLKEARLQKARLQEARLQGAFLQGAFLQGAFLQGAFLQEARLQKARLQGAFLQGAFLQEARLQKARLQEARLQEANLQGAFLQGAFLQGARIYKNVFIEYEHAVISKVFNFKNSPTRSDEESREIHIRKIEEMDQREREEKINKAEKKCFEDTADLRGALFYQRDLKKYNLDIENFRTLGLIIEEDPKLED